MICKWNNLPKLQEETTLVLGGFDGLHTGHKTLLAEAKKFSRPVALTSIDFGGETLFLKKERAYIFEKNGVDFLIEIPFNEVKDLSAEAFLSALSPLSFSAVVCGEDFRFGKGRSAGGKEIESITGKPVLILPFQKSNGEKISTRSIARLVQSGEIEKANAFLGDRYFLIGTVQKDRGIGKTLGFPTANLFPEKGKILPKTGVYETRVFMEREKTEYKAITNVGARPTFENDVFSVETHLLGFSGDLCGKEIRVEFVRFLRENQKFPDVEKLKAQLKEDERRVKKND